MCANHRSIVYVTIPRIRKYLDKESAATLIHAYITSKLDFNTSKGVVCQGRKYDHITPILQELHWLPIHYRSVFKIILTVFKSLNTEAPEYLKRKLHYRQYSRSLHSVSNKLLKDPRSRTKTYGDRAFSNIAQRLWNSIPNDIRNITNIQTLKRIFSRNI